MKIEEQVLEPFTFECEYCHSKEIDIKPLGQTYTYRKNNDNSDIKDEKIKKMYDKVKYIGNVLMESKIEDMLVTCKKCGTSFTPKKQIIRTELAAFLRKKGIEPIMKLGN